jgi:hypothetical protein
MDMEGGNNERFTLGLTQDAEFLQSFVRVGVAEDEEEVPTPKPSISKRVPQSAEKPQDEIQEEKQTVKEKKEAVKPRKKRERKPKRERRRREEELYTDKDRAAAVVMGSKDIKLSLNIKDKAERSSALHLPLEADSGTLLALARAEMMRERYKNAASFVDKVSRVPNRVVYVSNVPNIRSIIYQIHHGTSTNKNSVGVFSNKLARFFFKLYFVGTKVKYKIC